jgi:YVTN family beta-propeller protein
MESYKPKNVGKKDNADNSDSFLRKVEKNIAVGAMAVAFTLAPLAGCGGGGGGQHTGPAPLEIAQAIPSTQNVTLGNTATITDAGASGGKSPFQYQWMEKTPNSNSYIPAPDCENPASTTCTFATNSSTNPGNYSFQLTATDSETPTQTAVSNSVSVKVSSNSTPPLTIASPTPPTQSVTQGGTAAVNDSGASGGKGPIQYQWYEEKPNANSYTPAQDCINPTSLTCTLQTNSSTTTGNYNFELQATDSESPQKTVMSSSAVVTVNHVTIPTLTIASPTPPTQSVTQGNTASVNDSGASGGQGPYSYQWYEEKPNANSYMPAQDCTNSTSLTCTFQTNSSTQIGNYNFELRATDSESPQQTVTSSSSIVTVNQITGGQFQVAAPTPTNQSVVQGGTATVNDSGASGGLQPYYYQWLEMLPGSGSWINATDCTNQNGLTCAFATNSSTQQGTYGFELEAWDSANPEHIDTSSAAFITVNPVSSAPLNNLFVLELNTSPALIYVISSDQLTTTIQLSEKGYSIAANTNGAQVYVGEAQISNSQEFPDIAVINPNNNLVAYTIPLNVEPDAITITSQEKMLYLGGAVTSPPQNLEVVDIANSNTTDIGPTPSVPTSIALSQNDAQAWVGSANGTGVSVINTTTNQLAKTITADDAAFVAITPNGQQAYVSMPGSVQVFDTTNYNLLATIDLPNSPSSPTGQVVFTHDGSKAYAGNTNAVTVIDTSSLQVVNTIQTNTLSENIAITPDGKYIYVPNIINQNDNLWALISVIDTSTNSVSNEIELTQIQSYVNGFNQIKFSNDGTEAYIAGGQAGSQTGYVYIIDTGQQTVKSTIQLMDGNSVTMAPIAVPNSQSDTKKKGVSDIQLRH